MRTIQNLSGAALLSLRRYAAYDPLMASISDEKHLQILSAVRSIDLTTPIRMKLISLQIGKEVSAHDDTPDELLALLMEINRRLKKYDYAVAAGYIASEP